MTDKTVDINSRQSLIAIVFLAVIGPCVFIVQPGFVQGLVEYLKLSEQQAGLIASAEMWGIASGTLALIFLVDRMSWRRLCLMLLAFAVVGNLASVGQSDPVTLGVLRFVAGIGAGGLISITFTMAGLTRRADRSIALIIVWVLSYGAAVLYFMPQAYQAIGMAGVLVFFALFSLCGVVFVRFLPDSGDAHADVEGVYNYSMALRNLTLLAILVYNIGIGIVWAYLFLEGLATGMAEQTVANALMISQIVGIGGALFVVFFEVRLGRLVPMMIGFVGIAVAIAMLLNSPTQSDFWWAVCGFNLLWNLTMPYTISTSGDFDAKGQTVVYAIAVQMLGLAIGPYVAAQLLVGGDYDVVNSAAIAAFLLAGLMILPGVLAQRRRMNERA